MILLGKHFLFRVDPDGPLAEIGLVLRKLALVVENHGHIQAFHKDEVPVLRKRFDILYNKSVGKLRIL